MKERDWVILAGIAAVIYVAWKTEQAASSLVSQTANSIESLPGKAIGTAESWASSLWNWANSSSSGWTGGVFGSESSGTSSATSSGTSDSGNSDDDTMTASDEDNVIGGYE